MALTREEVQHIAMLARLELTAEEEATLAEQLAHILEYVETLRQVDTSTVEPTSHVVAMSTPFRDDRVRNRPRAEELLSNAPLRDDHHFKVPKIIE